LAAQADNVNAATVLHVSLRPPMRRSTVFPVIAQPVRARPSPNRWPSSSQTASFWPSPQPSASRPCHAWT